MTGRRTNVHSCGCWMRVRFPSDPDVRSGDSPRSTFVSEEIQYHVLRGVPITLCFTVESLRPLFLFPLHYWSAGMYFSPTSPPMSDSHTYRCFTPCPFLWISVLPGSTCTTQTLEPSNMGTVLWCLVWRSGTHDESTSVRGKSRELQPQSIFPLICTRSYSVLSKVSKLGAEII